MPAYDYVCSACKVEIEVIHDMNEMKKKCRSCGKMTLKRAWKKAAAFVTSYSPMHPRANRGKG